MNSGVRVRGAVRTRGGDMGRIPRVLTVALVACLAAALTGCVIDVEEFEARPTGTSECSP